MENIEGFFDVEEVLHTLKNEAFQDGVGTAIDTLMRRGIAVTSTTPMVYESIGADVSCLVTGSRVLTKSRVLNMRGCLRGW